MVIANIDDVSQTGQIILRPNYSWSRRLNLYLLYILMSVSLTVGTAFFIFGAWGILPYSLLEMLVLLSCLCYCRYQYSKQEVITVSQHDVRIEKGRNTPAKSWDYKRLWAKFMVASPRHPWGSTIISIRSHGREIELGSFLSRHDKIELIQQLKRIVP